MVLAGRAIAAAMVLSFARVNMVKVVINDKSHAKESGIGVLWKSGDL